MLAKDMGHRSTIGLLLLRNPQMNNDIEFHKRHGMPDYTQIWLKKMG